MERTYFIGVDIGTSGTKAVLCDLDGKVYGQSLREYGLHAPNPAWAEQDAECYLKASYETIAEVVRQSGVQPQSVKGMCISGLYGGSGIPLNRDMEPVAPCIIWMDRRAVAECEKLRETVDLAELFSVTGNGIDPYFGYAKLLWIKEHQPDVWEQAELFLTPNQYVIYKMTGETVIDHTSAGNLGGIYDMRHHKWAEDMMEKLGIPVSKLPQRILRPEDVAGTLTKQAAQELGLWEGLPVCAGCIDCLASTLATGALEDGQHVAIVSTSINWGVIHSDFPTNPDYVSMPYSKQPEKMIYTYGGASTAGALLRWFRDEVVPFIKDENGQPKEMSYREMDALAAKIPAGSSGLLVLPYFMGERSPIWDANARGTLFGLTLQHTNAHIYRALLEAAAYSLRHIMETSKIAVSGQSSCVLIGGASRSPLWRQIFADVTGVPVICSEDEVEAPLGDALIAAVGTGYAKDYDVVRQWVRFEKTVQPDPQAHQYYTRYYEIYKNLYHALKDSMREIAALSVRGPEE